MAQTLCWLVKAAYFYIVSCSQLRCHEAMQIAEGSLSKTVRAYFSSLRLCFKAGSRPHAEVGNTSKLFTKAAGGLYGCMVTLVLMSIASLTVSCSFIKSKVLSARCPSAPHFAYNSS